MTTSLHPPINLLTTSVAAPTKAPSSPPTENDVVVAVLTESSQQQQQLPPPEAAITTSSSVGKKRQLINTPPNSIEEIGGPEGLDRYTLDALKKLCKKIGYAVPMNASRASTCSALISIMTDGIEKNNNTLAEEDEVHEVYLVGNTRSAAAASSCRA